MTVGQLGYLVIEATDVEKWRNFATQVIGLASANGPNGALYLKADDRAFRVLIIPGETDRLVSSAWEMPTEAEFEALKARLQAADVSITALDEGTRIQRRVSGLFQVTDPSGNVIEAYWGPISDFTRFVSPVGVKGFVTGDMGLGHVVLPAINFDETAGFWVTHFGMGLSDILRLPIPGPNSRDTRIHFFHCNSRQHSLALAEMSIPSGCVHFMLEVPDLDEVGLALDRAAQHQAPLASTLGRHVNDEMVSFYIWTPGGFQIEFGCGGLVKDWKNENVVFETTRGSHWGHQWLAPPAA